MIRRNVFYNFMFQLVNVIVPIITAPYLSRILGAEGIGINSYSHAIAGYFVLFAMLGLNNYGSRSIALEKESRKELSNTFCGIYQMQFVMSTIVFLIYIVYVYMSKNTYKVALLINSLYVISAVLDINWFYFGLGEFKLTATRSMILKIFSTVAIFLCVKESEDIYIYVMIYTANIFISNIVMWFYLKKYIDIVFIPFEQWRKHIKPNLMLFIPALAVSIYKIMDKIMLGHMVGAVQNGYYECAASIVTIPLSLITAMGTVMLPKVSELIKKQEYEVIEKYNENTIQFLLAGSMPLTLGIIVVADDFVNVYYGRGFEECIPVLKMLAITCPFIAMGNVLRTQYIIPRKRDKVYVLSTILGAIVNFIFNIILIPEYGAKGAAVGTVAAEMTVMMYQFIKMRQYLKCRKIIKENYIFVIAGILMLCILSIADFVLGRFSLINLLIQICIGIVTYFFVVGIHFILFEKEKFKYWMNVIGIKCAKENKE